MAVARPAGDVLREWRQRRRLTQLDLALEAEISAKHLSFLETGRAQPSRDMVLALAEHLEMPLRERNTFLVSAGYAPVYGERPLDDPTLASAREAVDLVLKGHEPYPALAVDRHWNLVAANSAVLRLMTAPPALMKPPINVLRLSLHPEGLAPRIRNYAEWKGHVVARLKRQVEQSADPVLATLHDELAKYRKAGEPALPPAKISHAQVVLPMVLEAEGRVLSLFSTTTVFGTPVDITLAELAIESFFPADKATADALRQLAETRSQ
jgi:transcriptional regulator with XRE-family HTH domain